MHSSSPVPEPAGPESAAPVSADAFRPWPESAVPPVAACCGGISGNDAVIGQTEDSTPDEEHDPAPLHLRVLFLEWVMMTASSTHPFTSDPPSEIVNHLRARLRSGTLGGHIRTVKRPKVTMCEQILLYSYIAHLTVGSRQLLTCGNVAAHDVKRGAGAGQPASREADR
jgi:hypothetical protein